MYGCPRHVTRAISEAKGCIVHKMHFKQGMGSDTRLTSHRPSREGGSDCRSSHHRLLTNRVLHQHSGVRCTAPRCPSGPSTMQYSSSMLYVPMPPFCSSWRRKLSPYLSFWWHLLAECPNVPCRHSMPIIIPRPPPPPTKSSCASASDPPHRSVWDSGCSTSLSLTSVGRRAPKVSRRRSVNAHDVLCVIGCQFQPILMICHTQAVAMSLSMFRKACKEDL